MRVRILPYGPSESVNALKEGLFSQGINLLKLSTRGASRFRGRSGDVIINWGNSTFDGRDVLGNARVLNNLEAVRRASMKTTAFETMVGNQVSCVPHTTSREEAQEWLDNGDLVYARTVLQGHSGEGIVVCHRGGQLGVFPDSVSVSDELPQARLYTQGFTVQRREFRIHVMNGVVTYVQQKKREGGYQENPNYSNLVRNYHTGWIYATSNIAPNQAALDNAIRAVASLGLDFGAVDVITRGEDAWVLEVNTAPGLQGTNLETYVNNFVRIINGHNPINWGTQQEEITEPDEVIGNAVQVTREPDPIWGLETRGSASWNLESLPNETLETLLSDAPDRWVVSNGIIRGFLGDVRSTTATTNPLPPEPPRHEGFAHEAFYVGTVNGQRMIVQFNGDVDGFYMPGWEIPLVAGEDGFEINPNQEPV